MRCGVANSHANHCKLVTICSHGDYPADKPKVFYDLLVTENGLQLLGLEVRLSRKAGTVEMTQSIGVCCVGTRTRV